MNAPFAHGHLDLEYYLVGGAVRDALLGIDVTEFDYVVVGATREKMLELGFEQVGKDFPVFLHPTSREEFALARTERKVRPGHDGFECHADPGVTLIEDLQRRDLTVNAMARDQAGELIDPYGGRTDLEARQLRHVSGAFEEDPLRILRVARFLAQLGDFSFTVEKNTETLCQGMVARGDLAELPAERVFQEFSRALACPAPALFFRFTAVTGTTQQLWPEFTAGRIAAFEARLAAARLQGARLTAPQRFALLCYGTAVDEIRARGQALKAPGAWVELAALLARYFPTWRDVSHHSAAARVDFMKRIDLLRRPDRWDQFQEACAVLLGSMGEEDNPATSQYRAWAQVADVIRGISARDLEPGLKGPEIGHALANRWIAALEADQT